MIPISNRASRPYLDNASPNYQTILTLEDLESFEQEQWPSSSVAHSKPQTMSAVTSMD